MKNKFNQARFRELPLMGILRGITKEMVEPVVETSIRAGLGVLEITMNTQEAAGLIQQAIHVSSGRMAIGAGTVLSATDLKAAREAGAAFVVSPVLVPEVADLCVSVELPFFPGAFTPQEIFNAWHAGARMVKVFPAKFSGPEYFKELKGPFDRIPLMACGGVSADNANRYLACGAEAIAFGGSIYKKELLQQENWQALEEGLRALVEAYKKALPT